MALIVLLLLVSLLPFLSVSDFVHKCLDIVFVINTHSFRNTCKRSLCLADCFCRSISHDNLSILVLYEENFIARF